MSLTSEDSLFNTREVSLFNTREVSIVNTREVSIVNTREVPVVNTREVPVVNDPVRQWLLPVPRGRTWLFPTQPHGQVLADRSAGSGSSRHGGRRVVVWCTQGGRVVAWWHGGGCTQVTLLWQGVIGTGRARQTPWPGQYRHHWLARLFRHPAPVGLRITPRVAGQRPLYPGFNVPSSYFARFPYTRKSCSSERETPVISRPGPPASRVYLRTTFASR